MSLLGGIMHGLNQSLGDYIQKKDQDAANKAITNFLGSQGGDQAPANDPTAPPSSLATPPVAPPQTMPAAVSIPGATPMPGAIPPAGPGGAHPGVGAPMAQPPLPGVASPPRPVAAPPAAIPPQGGPVPAKPPMTAPALPAGSPTMPPGSPMGVPQAKDPQQILQALERGITQANPGIKPKALMAAMNQLIPMMKNVEPEQKLAMDTAIKMQMLQQHTQELEEKLAAAQTRLDETEAGKDKRQEETLQAKATQKDLDRSLSRWRINTQEAGKNARTKEQVDAANFRSMIGADNRLDVAQFNAGVKTNLAILAETGRNSRAGQAAAERLRAAYVAAGKAIPDDIQGMIGNASSGPTPQTPDRPARSAAPGQHYQAPPTTAGPKPTPGDVAKLKQLRGNPAAIKSFNDHFGAGAAERILKGS